MSGVSLPVTRIAGKALIVGQSSCRTGPAATLERLGFVCLPADDPYDAMAQICRRPHWFSAVILSLSSLYREELPIIASVKRRFPQLEIWLAHTDGRQAILAEAMRFGADGLLAEDGLHRIAAPTSTPTQTQEAEPPPMIPNNPPAHHDVPPHRVHRAKPATADSAAHRSSDPLLTAEELRALLHDHPTSGGESGAPLGV